MKIIYCNDEQKQYPKDLNFIVHIKKNLPRKQYFYSLLGFYLITSSYFALYAIPDAMEAQYVSMYRFTQHTILYMVPSLILFPLWPIKLRGDDFLAWLLPSVLLYAFFFLGAIIVFMSGFAHMPMLIFLLNILIALLLTSWQLVAGLATVGIAIAVLVFNHFVGGIPAMQQALSIKFIVGYSFVLISSALIALFRFKENQQNLQQNAHHLTDGFPSTFQGLVNALKMEERLVLSVGKEGIQELQQTAKANENLVDQFLALTKHIPSQEAYQKEILHVKDQLQTTVQYVNQMADQTTAYMRLQLSHVSIKTMLKQTVMDLYFNHLVEEPNVIVRLDTRIEHKMIQSDIPKMKHFFTHAITYVLRSLWDTRRRVLVHIEATKLAYKQHAEPIPALRISITTLDNLPVKAQVYESNIEATHLDIPITDTTVDLLLAKRVVQAYYGYMSIALTGHDQITQVYVIPQDITEIRPKEELDMVDMEKDTSCVVK